MAPSPTSSRGDSPLLVRYPIAYNTPGLATTGVTIYTAAVGDIVAEVAVSVTAAWNGSSPRLGVGTSAGSTTVVSADLTAANADLGDGLSVPNVPLGISSYMVNVPTAIKAAVFDNNVGFPSNPGSTAGIAEIILVILRRS